MQTEDDSIKKEYTMTSGEANKKALLFILPIILIAAGPYFMIWEFNFEKADGGFGEWSFLVVFLVGIIVHELIHGLCSVLYAKHGFKSVRFGVMWKTLTPYCHCKEPLTAKQYRVVALMPSVILGILPVVYSWLVGDYRYLLFGGALLLGGAGDFLIVWMMRKLKKDDLVKDHPDKIGFRVLEK